MDWKQLITSKRFIAIVVGIVVVLSSKVLGEGVVDEATITKVVGLIISWVVSDGLRGLPHRYNDAGTIAGPGSDK